MTSGSKTISNRGSNTPWTINGSSQPSAVSGTYKSKSWTGGDAVMPPRSSRGKERKYTVVDRKGRVRVKKFYERPQKASKFRTPNAYSMSARTLRVQGTVKYRRVFPGFWDELVEGGLWLGSSGTWPPPASDLTPPLPAFTANDQLTLINRLKEQIRGSDFNMAVTLGEGREALAMVGDAAIRIARGLSFARKGNFLAAIQAMSHSALAARRNTDLLPKRLKAQQIRRQSVDQFSSNWLELQYGWLPLLSDVKSGAEFLSHHLHVPRRQRYVARLKVKNPDPHNVMLGTAEMEAFVSRQIIAYISEKQDSIPVILGLMDPEIVLWELTPFSFVADWVAPIGDYLEARAFSSRLEGLFVTTTKTLRLAEGGLVSHTNGTISSIVQDGGIYDERLVTVERTVSTNLGVPFPAVKPLGEIASWKHCANAIALLAQVSKSVVSRNLLKP